MWSRVLVLAPALAGQAALRQVLCVAGHSRGKHLKVDHSWQTGAVTHDEASYTSGNVAMSVPDSGVISVVVIDVVIAVGVDRLGLLGRGGDRLGSCDWLCVWLVLVLASVLPVLRVGVGVTQQSCRL